MGRTTQGKIMNDSVKSTKPSANKPLWAAVAVLTVAVLAMGAALIRIQSKPVDPHLAVLNTVAPKATSDTPASLVPVPDDAKRPVTPPKEAPMPVTQTRDMTQPVAQNRSAPASTPSNQPTQPGCTHCGTVISVTALQREVTGSGVGTVAGGVLGAMVGNQVGGGTGKTLATILGAVGGGYAGNTVEKRMNQVTSYRINVRMEDGSIRTLEQATPASVGEEVVVDGNTLRPTNR
ncbi:MAG: outer membrane lipoprotein SlyB [Rhodoferax sp.]|jgi:outer membrane lipoprotein SlyB